MLSIIYTWLYPEKQNAFKKFIIQFQEGTGPVFKLHFGRNCAKDWATQHTVSNFAACSLKIRLQPVYCVTWTLSGNVSSYFAQIPTLLNRTFLNVFKIL